MQILRSIILALGFVVAGGVAAVGQDFEKGKAAFLQGDYETAFIEIRPIAERGDAEAQAELGLMYFVTGFGGEDFGEAFKWSQLAADQGVAKAQSILGQMYRNGNGVDQDYKEAFKWYRLAAEQGDKYSHARLAELYKEGLGVTQYKVLAHMWYNISSANGLNKSVSVLIDSLAEKMTLADISKAEAMAHLCMSSGYKDCGW